MAKIIRAREDFKPLIEDGGYTLVVKGGEELLRDPEMKEVIRNYTLQILELMVKKLREKAK